MIVHKIAEIPHQTEYNKLNITDPKPFWERRSDFQGQVLKAGWIFATPFIYLSGAYENINDGHHFLTGVNYDVAQSLAYRCNFSMQFEEVDAYGAKQENGSWTGMVEKLRKKELDIAIADLTVTTERTQVIDLSLIHI